MIPFQTYLLIPSNQDFSDWCRSDISEKCPTAKVHWETGTVDEFHHLFVLLKTFVQSNFRTARELVLTIQIWIVHRMRVLFFLRRNLGKNGINRHKKGDRSPLINLINHTIKACNCLVSCSHGIGDRLNVYSLTT